MSTLTAWNLKRYRLLLGRIIPVAIDSEEEYGRMLAAAERLMDRGENLSEEEGRLLRLLAILIEDYEQRNYPLPKAPPDEMLKELLEEKGLKASDLWPVMGSKSHLSEILSGRRAVSKSQAKKLAEFFQVSVDLFI
jgi:HTH-type transcriptional regulator/antitoxin HigA